MIRFERPFSALSRKRTGSFSYSTDIWYLLDVKMYLGQANKTGCRYLSGLFRNLPTNSTRPTTPSPPSTLIPRARWPLTIKPRPNVELFMTQTKLATSDSVKFFWMSLDRPTRSIRLLQTDRTSEDRLRDKHWSSHATS